MHIMVKFYILSVKMVHTLYKNYLYQLLVFAINPIQVGTFFKPGVLGKGHMAHPMYFFSSSPLKVIFSYFFIGSCPRVYLGKVKKSQGVIC